MTTSSMACSSEWNVRVGGSPCRPDAQRRGVHRRREQPVVGEERQGFEQGLVMADDVLERARSVVVKIWGGMADAEQRRHIEPSEFTAVAVIAAPRIRGHHGLLRPVRKGDDEPALLQVRRRQPIEERWRGRTRRRPRWLSGGSVSGGVRPASNASASALTRFEEYRCS
jgi:hypothetical protein